MRALYSLLNSLHRLTRISAFRDLANLCYKADRTKREVENVKRDANRLKEQAQSKKSA